MAANSSTPLSGRVASTRAYLSAKTGVVNTWMKSAFIQLNTLFVLAFGKRTQTVAYISTPNITPVIWATKSRRSTLFVTKT